jgi:uncharacterized protein
MQVEHHDLHHEFPEYGARIHYLKTTDAHFGKLFREYDELDHSIRRIENGGSLMADRDLTTLKAHRVALKDELYGYLSQPI